MADPKVNGARLKRALDEFGSLQEAVDSLKGQREALRTDVSALAKGKTNLLQEITRLELNIKKREENLTRLEEASQKYKQDVDEYVNSIKQFMLQYHIFESFLAMLQTSAPEKKSIKDLATRILMVGEAVWQFDEPPDKLRYLFVTTVLGDHLKCYRCSSCGLKFIVNSEPQSHFLGYSCPGCHLAFSVRPDDSFLEAMLSSSIKPINPSETQDQKK